MIPIDDYRRSTKSPHDILRENVFNYDQYRKTKKAQRQQQGKMTSRTTFSFRTPGAVVRYDSRTKEKKRKCS